MRFDAAMPRAEIGTLEHLRGARAETGAVLAEVRKRRDSGRVRADVPEA